VNNQSTEDFIAANKKNLSKTQKISNHELGENSEDLAHPM